MRLTAGTGNRAKVAALQRLVGPDAVVSPPPHDISLETDEDGLTVEGVASAKAIAWSRAVGGDRLVVATDGGLLIPALGDAWNPVRTRRFAPEADSDVERARALIGLASGLAGAERRIGWREAMAVARGGTLLASWSAESPSGVLAEAVDSGAAVAGGGFWVPAVWRCPEFGGRLLAHLTVQEQGARRDHWVVLGERLREFLEASSVNDGGAAVGE